MNVPGPVQNSHKRRSVVTATCQYQRKCFTNPLDSSPIAQLLCFYFRPSRLLTEVSTMIDKFSGSTFIEPITCSFEAKHRSPLFISIVMTQICFSKVTIQNISFLLIASSLSIIYIPPLLNLMFFFSSYPLIPCAPLCSLAAPRCSLGAPSKAALLAFPT